MERFNDLSSINRLVFCTSSRIPIPELIFCQMWAIYCQGVQKLLSCKRLRVLSLCICSICGFLVELCPVQCKDVQQHIGVCRILHCSLVWSWIGDALFYFNGRKMCNAVSLQPRSSRERGGQTMAVVGCIANPATILVTHSFSACVVRQFMADKSLRQKKERRRREGREKHVLCSGEAMYNWTSLVLRMSHLCRICVSVPGICGNFWNGLSWIHVWEPNSLDEKQ